jgi:hypothetical protein
MGYSKTHGIPRKEHFFPRNNENCSKSSPRDLSEHDFDGNPIPENQVPCNSVADPDPGSWDPGLGAFLTPGSGIRDPGSWMGESQHPDPGSGMNNPDHIFWSLETIFLLF